MRHRARPYYGSIGSISHGTLRPEDLFAAFMYECKQLRLSRAERNTVRKIDANTYTAETEDETLDERLDYDVEALEDILENHAPPYMYFGTHEGDGADFGYWLPSDFQSNMDDVLKVNDTSEVPKGYTGEVLCVNDHGNCTLYSVSRGRMREVWSVV